MNTFRWILLKEKYSVDVRREEREREKRHKMWFNNLSFFVFNRKKHNKNKHNMNNSP